MVNFFDSLVVPAVMVNEEAKGTYQDVANAADLGRITTRRSSKQKNQTTKGIRRRKDFICIVKIITDYYGL